MERVEEVKRKSNEKESRFGKRYGFELKLRCCEAAVGRRFPVPLLAKRRESVRARSSLGEGV